MNTVTASAAERFWVKVEKTGGCWLWTAFKGAGGYGNLRVGTRMVRAHRFAYELLVGPIPDGLQLDHLCRVRHCVNPTHLEPVSNRRNLLRGETLAAENAAKSHCPAGHAYNAANTYRQANGSRACRPCRAEAQRRYRSRRAA